GLYLDVVDPKKFYQAFATRFMNNKENKINNENINKQTKKEDDKDITRNTKQKSGNDMKQD
ncbi:7714_t:CDS:1, partial [Ambispora leptoticha]